MRTRSGDPSASTSPWLLPVLLLCAALVAYNGTSGIFVVPSVANHFGIQLDAAQWIATATLIAGAVASPVLSRLAGDAHRHKFMLGILAGVVGASAFCAIAPNFTTLLIARTAQGASMALIPLAVATARDSLPPDRATRFASTITTTTTIAMGFTYAITGGIIEFGSFREVFWCEALLALVAFVLLARTPHPQQPGTRVRLDIVGSLLLICGLIGLLLGVALGPHLGLGDWRVIALLVGSLLSLASWGAFEWHSSAPLVNVRLLLDRALLGSVLCTFMLAISLYVAISLNSRFLQQPVAGQERSLLTIGITLFPIALGAFLGMRLRPHLVRHLPLHAIITIGSLLMGSAMVWLGLHRVHLWEFSIAVFLLGLAGSFTFSVMPQILIHEVPPAETADSSSMNQVMRLIGASIGSTVSVAILTSLTPGGSQTEASDTSYTAAYLLGAVFTVIAAVIALTMLRGVTISTPASQPAAVTTGTQP